MPLRSTCCACRAAGPSPHSSRTSACSTSCAGRASPRATSPPCAAARCCWGLLGGYRATTHWLSLELLQAFGADPVDDRVVRDRNRITGAGVTAGIDFALVVAAEVFGT